MIERFEQLTLGIARVYKSIQKIKKQSMEFMELKSTQVMCLYYLGLHPEGLTAAEICRLCLENKAGISRILTVLEDQGLITYQLPPGGKNYRSKAILTPLGRTYTDKVNEAIQKAVEAASQGLDPKERRIFYKVLAQIADNLEAFCNEAEQNETERN